MTRILVLAGTQEARRLTKDLAGIDALSVTASLAGVTEAPAPLAAETRVGGFGGAEGLAQYLTEQRITALVDATHPYARQMQANAVRAADLTQTPRLRLLRAPWPPRPTWQAVRDISAAATALPPGARALLTTGRKELAPFAARTDCELVLRTIEKVAGLPPHITPLRARPPFTLESEQGFIALLGITHLVTKNAGCSGTAKLDAADAARLTTIVVDRPTPPPGPRVATAEEAVAWVRRTVGL